MIAAKYRFTGLILDAKSKFSHCTPVGYCVEYNSVESLMKTIKKRGADLNAPNDE